MKNLVLNAPVRPDDGQQLVRAGPLARQRCDAVGRFRGGFQYAAVSFANGACADQPEALNHAGEAQIVGVELCRARQRARFKPSVSFADRVRGLALGPGQSSLPRGKCPHHQKHP